MHALETSPFELLTHLAAASQGGELILSQADLLTTYCCKGLNRGSFSSILLAQMEHLFQLHILLTFLFSSFVCRCLASTCLLPSATCLPLCLRLLCSCPLSLLPEEGSTEGCIVPGCSPGAFLTCSLLQPQPRLASPGHPRHRQSREQRQRGRKEPQQAGCQHSSGTNRHTSSAGSPGSRDKQGHRVGAAPARSCGSSLHLHTETYGKAKESQHLYFITKHPSCHSILLAALLSAAAVVLKCCFHLHLAECPWIVKGSVLCVLRPLAQVSPTVRHTVLLAPPPCRSVIFTLVGVPLLLVAIAAT